jgi:hypothetical protein
MVQRELVRGQAPVVLEVVSPSQQLSVTRGLFQKQLDLLIFCLRLHLGFILAVSSVLFCFVLFFSFHVDACLHGPYAPINVTRDTCS